MARMSAPIQNIGKRKINLISMDSSGLTPMGAEKHSKEK